MPSFTSSPESTPPGPQPVSVESLDSAPARAPRTPVEAAPSVPRDASPTLLTPVLIKTSETMPWPDDQGVFHLVTGDGLYVCRNHEFFVSSVPTDLWPAELPGHAPFLHLRYPRLPQRLFEQIVGFFSLIGDAYGAEAAVLLAWNREQKQVEAIVPWQRSLVSSGWSGKAYPISVEYDMPILPAACCWIADLHSHVEEGSHSSSIDERDERHRPGIHLIVGRISQEPPEFSITAVVDGLRFRVRHLESVVEGYDRRRADEVPADWIGKVSVWRWGSHGQQVRVPPRSGFEAFAAGPAPTPRQAEPLPPHSSSR